jgi:hypothetical protein
MSDQINEEEQSVDNKGYRELRCQNDSCRKMYLYEKILIGKIAFVCKRCGTLNERVFTMLKSNENLAIIEEDLMKGGEK